MQDEKDVQDKVKKQQVIQGGRLEKIGNKYNRK